MSCCQWISPGPTFEAVDAKARTAVIVLTPPQASSPRLDHDRTRMLAMTESGLWAITSGANRSAGKQVHRRGTDA